MLRMQKRTAVSLVILAAALTYPVRYRRPDLELLVQVVAPTLGVFGSYFLARTTEGRLKNQTNRWIRRLVPAVVFLVSFLAVVYANALIGIHFLFRDFGR